MPDEKIVIEGMTNSSIETATKKGRGFAEKEVLSQDKTEKEVLQPEKTVKVRFKRDINFYYGEKRVKYAFNTIKTIPIGQYEVLKANPNNLEIVY